MPRVSIVLPTFNRAIYIDEAVASCLAQTFTDWELLIVTDPLTPEAEARVERLVASDSRIRCFANDRGGRLPGALNAGFAQAAGDLWTWMSDDNRFQPEALATMVAWLDHHSDCDFVYTDYDIFEQDTGERTRYQAKPPERLIQGDHRIQSFLYRRTVRDKVGEYDPAMFLAEDYDYWLRCYQAGIVMTPRPDNLYEYRHHADSLSDTTDRMQFRVAERAILRIMPSLPLTRKQRGGAYLYLASLMTWYGDQRSMLRYTLQAFPYAPGQTLGKVGQFVGKRLQGSVR